MKVGDLVRCTTVDGKPVVGLVVSHLQSLRVVNVLLTLRGKSVTVAFQTKQVELVNESR
jgi:hypothetical protein